MGNATLLWDFLGLECPFLSSSGISAMGRHQALTDRKKLPSGEQT